MLTNYNKNHNFYQTSTLSFKRLNNFILRRTMLVSRKVINMNVIRKVDPDILRIESRVTSTPPHF